MIYDKNAILTEGSSESPLDFLTVGKVRLGYGVITSKRQGSVSVAKASANACESSQRHKLLTMEL